MSSSGGDLGRALCVVTGASRGFGRAVAVDLSRLVRPGSVLVLVARSVDDLRALQAELARPEAGGTGLTVKCVEADLAQTDGVERAVKASEEAAAAAEIEHMVLVNNAASLGDVSRCAQSFTRMAEVDSYLSFNVSSALCLTARLLQAFPRRPGLRRTVVNVSSLCAVQPYPTWVLYCSGKAARDMMFRVLAEEEPDIRVLSYAPGPLDTAMQTEARSTTADPKMKQMISDLFAQGRLLSCEESSAKLMKLLLEDKFTSGSHVDIYDV
ncbi:sepiapterin reductase a [Betta splendens]|uniref:Sepiapterin reductase n=1 Tax=Betta splendens TaxID=158456 RepID=A0A6P7P1K6_BETSP|nr:sepiapterin reductase a [Betta splendens]